MGRDGGGQRQLTRPPRPLADLTPAWSADGTRVYFSRWADHGPAESIFSVRGDGSGLRRLTTVYWRCDSRPAPSPDGRMIVFASITCDRPQATGETPKLQAVDANGRQVKMPFSIPSDVGTPAWSPNGRRLAYAHFDRVAEMMQATPERGDSCIYISALGTSVRRRLPLPPPSAEADVPVSPAWSPDGNWIAFTMDAGGPGGDIWLVRADGTRLQRLTQGRAWDGDPAWLMRRS